MMRAVPAAPRAGRAPAVDWAAAASCLRHGAWSPPEAIAGLRIGAQIGRGRSSQVHLAWRTTGEAVAVKLASRRQLEALGRLEGFAPEYTVAQAVRHPHLLRSVAHGMDARTAFLATEHAAGGCISGPLPPDEVLAVARQAAAGLAALHAAGWVHRDVKPANLLRRADGTVALSDFGSACRAGSPGRVPGTVIGTPRYAAPEQTRGAPAQPAADVYGLGVALYELLAAVVPFPGQTLAELLAQHLLAPVPRLPDALAGWQPLLDDLLAKDPAARPADGAAVLARLA